MHLSDCFVPILHKIASLKDNSEAVVDVTLLNCELTVLFTESEESAAQAGFNSEEFLQARFAVCAYVDETILASTGCHQLQWIRESLQRRYYHTSEAGEEFFIRLNALKPQQREVREVYFLCLALGFTGRYCGPGDDGRLAQLKSEQLHLLVAGLPPLPEDHLFPQAYPDPSPAPGRISPHQWGRIPALVAWFAPLLLFLALIGVFQFTLQGSADGIYRSMRP